VSTVGIAGTVQVPPDMKPEEPLTKLLGKDGAVTVVLWCSDDLEGPGGDVRLLLAQADALEEMARHLRAMTLVEVPL